ncbi:MAG: S24 family peptidase [Candidatus Moranbacteria bacterium]|nr:S24 family peptidase [Candidatus Moranbacteria bacterium]
MEKLTSKQKMVLDAIREIIEQGGGNPTSYKLHKHLEERGIEVGSLKGTMQVIEALEKKDLIKRDSDKKLFMVENDSYANFENIFSMPMYGLASCGEALAYADGNVDGYLQISKSLFRQQDPAQLFAVKALGDSMNKEGIGDGDYVVFEKADNSADYEGKIVVAVINGMATIKRYKKLPHGMIGLFPQSTNKVHQPIYLDESDTILVAGIFKKVLPVAYVSL